MLSKTLSAAAISLGITFSAIGGNYVKAENLNSKPGCEKNISHSCLKSQIKKSLDGLVTLYSYPYLNLIDQKNEKGEPITIQVNGGFGSGVVHDGYVFTAKHVKLISSESLRRFSQTFPGEFEEAFTLIWTSENVFLDEVASDIPTDVSILKVEDKDLTGKFKVKQKFMRENEVYVGQEVYYFQNSHLESTEPKYFTKANVAVKFSQLVEISETESIRKTLICLDKGVDKGTSGSGLFDYNSGNLLGIIVENHNFGTVDRACAIPIDVFEETYKSLKKN